jgi:hypothetical protein
MNPRSRWRPAVLLALVALVVVAGPLATVSIVTRGSALSFDNPATQVLDELSSQKLSHVDRLLEAADVLGAAAGTSRRLAAGERAGYRPAHVRSGLEARAPPSA